MPPRSLGRVLSSSFVRRDPRYTARTIRDNDCGYVTSLLTPRAEYTNATIIGKFLHYVSRE